MSFSQTSVVCLVVCLAVCLFSGCSSTRDPSIAVNGARLGEVTEEALTLHIALHLDNPNAESLELLEFQYEVEVDGKCAYSGTRAAEMTLEQLSTREVDLPAVVLLSEHGWSDGALPPTVEFKVHGTLRYLLPGAIAHTLFDTGVRRPSAGVHGSGVVSLQTQ